MKELTNQTSVKKLLVVLQKRGRRAVKAGYPLSGPFASRADVDAYLDAPKIVCLQCGNEYHTLAKHLAAIHRMSSDDYRVMYGLPFSRGLNSPATHEKMSEKMYARPPEFFEALIAQVKNPEVQQRSHAAPGRITPINRAAICRNLSPRKPTFTSSDGERVIQHMEQNRALLADALTKCGLGMTVFRKILRRDPALKERYAAIAGVARRAGLMGNKHWAKA